jgi:hypothetical protein
VATQTDRIDEHRPVLRNESGPQPFKHLCRDDTELLLGVQVEVDLSGRAAVV